MIVCIRTERQCVGIWKTYDVFQSARQRKLGFPPCVNKPEKTSQPSFSVKIEETVKPSDTEADLLLNISSRQDVGTSHTEEKTEYNETHRGRDN